MNIKKEIGQLFAVGFPGKNITPEIKTLIHDYHIGSIILFAHNIGTPQEVFQLTKALQREAKEAGYKYPLLIAIDEENGTVKRLGKDAGEYPGAMAVSATDDLQIAYDLGVATGDNLSKLGINWNYAPVLDVNNNPNNPVIGVRSFGENPETVAKFGVATMKGLQDGGVATSIKHFPGHGDTNIDSHFSMPRIDHSIDRLHEVELMPFKTAIKEGADSVMTAHIVFPALESEEGRPATLSKKIITNLLREELDFNGVIVTDALEMKAISDNFGISEGAVEALNAGADKILIGHLPEEQFKALKRVEEAVINDEISKKRIKESLTRVNELKEKYTNWQTLDLENTSDIPKSFNNKKKQDLVYKAYKNSVTVLKKGAQLKEDTSILVLQPKDELSTIAEDITEDNFVLTKVIKKDLNDVDVEMVTNELTSEQFDRLIQKVKKYDRIIAGTMNTDKKSNYVKLLQKISESQYVDLISMKNPYIGQWINNSNFWINTYEPNKIPVEIAIQTLLGKTEPSGKSPVKLQKMF
jgi:beta-N-acetylhexosaminidase